MKASANRKIFLTALYTLTFCYCGLIFFLSNQTSGAPSFFANFDKILHFIEYGILGALGALAFSFHSWPLHWKQLGMLGTLFASFYGLTDEWHQRFVPERESTIADWVADTLGGATGSFISAHFLDKFHKSRFSQKFIWSARVGED